MDDYDESGGERGWSCPHTPGPWSALRCQNGWHIGPQPGGVCSIMDNSDGSSLKEHEANAHLIAAAPDLLIACEVAKEVIVDYEELLAACQALLDADHPDHFAARLSDSEMEALERIKYILWREKLCGAEFLEGLAT